MTPNTVRLDLRGLSPDQQVGVLRDRYGELRGTGALVRARFDELPVRPYISMLESGYRVSLEREDSAMILALRPDGSTPRLGVRGAHSIVAHEPFKSYGEGNEDNLNQGLASLQVRKKDLQHDGRRSGNTQTSCRSVVGSPEENSDKQRITDRALNRYA